MAKPSVPQTADNFRRLCTGDNDRKLSYNNSVFHRIIPGFIAQAGDVIDGSGMCKLRGASISLLGLFEGLSLVLILYGDMLHGHGLIARQLENFLSVRQNLI